MPFAAYFFASGAAFFAGAGVIAIASAMSSARIDRGATLGLRIVSAAGVALVVASAAPLPWWLYGVWAVALLAAGAARKVLLRLGRWRMGLGLPLRIIAVGITLAAMAVELPYHRRPEPPTERYRQLVVIGDALASADAGEPAWPEMLARDKRIDTLNLAKPDATALTAVVQARAAPAQRSIVVVALGVNDLRAGTPASMYEASLNAVLRTVHHPQRQIVLVELPLPPLKNAYGRAQRRLAKRYDAILIPKSYLAAALPGDSPAAPAAFLTPEGHRRMGSMLWALAVHAVEPRREAPVDVAMRPEGAVPASGPIFSAALSAAIEQRGSQ